jgi:hypothetical protein
MKLFFEILTNVFNYRKFVFNYRKFVLEQIKRFHELNLKSAIKRKFFKDYVSWNKNGCIVETAVFCDAAMCHEQQW